MGIVLVGDTHFKKWEQTKKQLDLLEFLDSEYRQDDLIFLGDVFDTPSPHWDVYTEVYSWFKKRSENSNIYILHGNHEDNLRRGSSLDAFKILPNTHLITDVTELDIQGKKWLFLPYALHAQKEFMELEGNYDYIATHNTPVKHQFFDEGFDLPSSVSAKACFWGHIHTQDEYEVNNIIYSLVGVPYPTRVGEENWTYRVAYVDDETFRYKAIPTMYDYNHVQYGELPDSDENFVIIENAPSDTQAREFYSDYMIKKVILKRTVSDLDNEDALEGADILEDTLDLESKFVTYAKEEDLDGLILSKGVELLSVASASED
jgi:DNA repair exonuclease SbcCD nuclease subunit